MNVARALLALLPLGWPGAAPLEEAAVTTATAGGGACERGGWLKLSQYSGGTCLVFTKEKGSLPCRYRSCARSVEAPEFEAETTSIWRPDNAGRNEGVAVGVSSSMGDVCVSGARGVPEVTEDWKVRRFWW